MVKILKLIDIFPQNFLFTYKGRNSIKTTFGGIISIFALLSILINAILIGKDIYYREKPHVIKVTKEENYTSTIRVNYNNTKIGFAVSDSDIVDDESLIQIYPVYFVQKKRENKLLYKEYILDIENCTKNKDDPIFYHKCIKNLDVYLSGSWGEDSVSFLKIHFRKCSNETYIGNTNIQTEDDEKFLDNFLRNISNYHNSEYIGNKEFNQGLDINKYLKEYKINKNKTKVVCRSKEEIEEKLNSNLYVNFFYDKIRSDPKNYKNSLQKILKMDSHLVGNDIFKGFNLFYTKYVAEIDSGLIFEDIKIEQKELGINSINNDFKFTKDSKELLGLYFYASKEVKFIEKRYLKLPNIFSELGGFINLTFLILNLISFPYFEKKKKLKIINEFFEFYDEDHNPSKKISNTIQLDQINNNLKKNLIIIIIIQRMI